MATKLLDRDLDIRGTARLLKNGTVLIDGDGNVTANITDSLASGKIYVGNSSGVSAEVAVSGDATLADTGALTIASAVVTRAKMSSAAGSKSAATGGTIATTATSVATILAPTTGTVSGVDFSGNDTLATSDTNYITWTITNLGQSGSGTAAILAATDANTTKTTGGSAVTALTRRQMTLTGTGADLVVAQGDRLKITATITGTLANTVTGSVYSILFAGTT